MGRNIISSDEFPARTNYSMKEEKAVEPVSTTQKMMNKAKDEKVFITLIVGIIIYVATQAMAMRDLDIEQPYIDKLQNQRMQQIEKDVGEIKSDIKTLLGRKLVSRVD